MRFLSVLFMLISVSSGAQQQNVHGRYLARLGFRLFNDGGKTYCVFAAAKDPDHVTFRRILFDENLHPLDSIDFGVPGEAWLGGIGADRSHNYYTFMVKKPIQAWTFVVTDKRGVVLHFITKTKRELLPLIKIHDNILYHQVTPLGFIEDKLLVVQIAAFSSSHIIAFNVKDGSVAWHNPKPYLSQVQQTDSLIIGLSHTYHKKRHITTVHYLDKYNGATIGEFALNPKRKDYMQIGAVACNGRNLIIAGEEYSNAKGKHSHFFLSSYDLRGRLVFQRTDTVDRLNKYRIMVMGSTFDQDGNIVLLGEAYKPDVNTESEVALASVLLSGASGATTVHEIDKVDFITSTVCSPETGDILKFRYYPVGPWRHFSEFQSYGRYVMMKVLNKIMFYDVDTPEIPPVKYASVGMMEPTYVTPNGPVSIRYVGLHTVQLKLVQPDR